MDLFKKNNYSKISIDQTLKSLDILLLNNIKNLFLKHGVNILYVYDIFNKLDIFHKNTISDQFYYQGAENYISNPFINMSTELPISDLDHLKSLSKRFINIIRDTKNNIIRTAPIVKQEVGVSFGSFGATAVEVPKVHSDDTIINNNIHVIPNLTVAGYNLLIDMISLGEPNDIINNKYYTNYYKYKNDMAREEKNWIVTNKLKATQLSADGNNLCIVTDTSDVYCKKKYISSSWNKIASNIKHISINDGKLYSISNTNDISHNYNINYNTVKSIPNPPSEKLKQISMHGKRVCGVSENDNIYCKNDLYSSDWNYIAKPKLKYISLYKKELVGVNINNDIFHINDITNPTCKQITGAKLKTIERGINSYCGIDINNDILCKHDLNSPLPWSKLALTTLSSISIDGKYLYSINADGSIKKTK